jgi:hypothetical protein
VREARAKAKAALEAVNKVAEEAEKTEDTLEHDYAVSEMTKLTCVMTFFMSRAGKGREPGQYSGTNTDEIVSKVHEIVCTISQEAWSPDNKIFLILGRLELSFSE